MEGAYKVCIAHNHLQQNKGQGKEKVWQCAILAQVNNNMYTHAPPKELLTNSYRS